MSTNLEFINRYTAVPGVAYLETPDLFSAAYDVYWYTITKFSISADEVYELKLLDSSNSVIEADYDWVSLQLKSNTSFVESKNTNRPKVDFMSELDGDLEKNTGLSGYIYNPYLSSSYTYGNIQSSGMDGTNLFGSKNVWRHGSAVQINGVRFAPQSPKTINQLEVNMYGVK